MAKKADPNKLELFKDIFRDYLVQLDALTQALIEKGLITNDEFLAKLDKIRQEYDQHHPICLYSQTPHENFRYRANNPLTRPLFLQMKPANRQLSLSR